MKVSRERGRSWKRGWEWKTEQNGKRRSTKAKVKIISRMVKLIAGKITWR